MPDTIFALRGFSSAGSTPSCTARAEKNDGSRASTRGRRPDPTVSVRDGAAHQLANLAEDILRRDPELAMRGDPFHERLGGFSTDRAGSDRALFNFADRDDRRQPKPAVPAAERTVM